MCACEFCPIYCLVTYRVTGGESVYDRVPLEGAFAFDGGIYDWVLCARGRWLAFTFVGCVHDL